MNIDQLTNAEDNNIVTEIHFMLWKCMIPIVVELIFYKGSEFILYN